ncbi:MAG: holo-ACP synthase [Bacteroidales bacterium]|nr:holo-ACP synthase [Bacteroidales bacterium]
MIFGIGTDIIEVARIEKQLANNQALKSKLFTHREQIYSEGKSTMYQHYAARFAAKEAFFKALGTGYRFGMAFHEIEVVNDELGKPVIHLHGKVADFLRENQIAHVHLSISHVKEMAVAYVVLEK